MNNNQPSIKILTKNLLHLIKLHLVEVITLGWDLLCRPKKKIIDWRDTSNELKDRVNSILRYMCIPNCILFTIAAVAVASSFSLMFYYMRPLSLFIFVVGIVLLAATGIRIITTSMVLYGNNFNCPKCLLPFVVIHFYFSYIVISRYKEMFQTNIECESPMENSTEKGINYKNNLFTVFQDEKNYTNNAKDKDNSCYIFLDNQYNDSGTKPISLPEVHK